MMLHNKSRWLPQDYFSFGAISLLLVTVALSSWFISRHGISLRIQAQLEELQQQSALAAATVSQDLQQGRRQVEDIAQALASLSSLQAFLNNPRRLAPLQADLDNLGSIFGLDGIWLIGRQGKIMVQSPVGQSPPALDHFAASRQPVHRFILEPEQQQARFYYATPLGDTGTAVLLVRAAVDGISRRAYRVELLVTDPEGMVALADNPEWLLHTFNGSTAPPSFAPESREDNPAIPISQSPLLPEVLLLGPHQKPVLLASHATENGDYRVYALADAAPIYHLARKKDNLTAIITLAATGSLWGGLLTILTLKRNRRHRLAFSKANDELVRLNQQLKQLATTDALTRCPNRRAAEARLQYELANLQRYHHPFCIVMVDIDHFKHINDQHGHDIGDKVLRHFAHTGRQAIRDTDVLARIGGEEFLLILPDTDHQQGLHLARRLLDTISATPLYLADRTIGISFSGGLTEARKTDNTNDLLVRADRALYRAKEKGRCRICSENLVMDQSVAVG
ncbi:GGDEF domain-containing protein [Zobellella sp. DQSA1]|uniref:sensor domain-containing diguanylate cyclase n=1 Tax=Zobellella sp. DQSA1 TaxID=3342386 RepID=UPI0035C15197